MSSAPPQALIDQIANAISRIERAGVRSPAPAAGSGQLQALESRHAKLRAESAAALTELDALIVGNAR